MPESDAPLGGWLADIGANLLCVVLVLLVLLSLAPALPRGTTPAATLPIVRTAPVSGLRGVQLLSHLVLPPEEDFLVLSLTPDSLLLRVSQSEAAPITPEDLPAEAPGATVFVFDAEHHSETVAALRSRAIPFVELTVPDAMRAPPGTEAGPWAPGYLAALEGVQSIDGFRAALRTYLRRADEANRDALAARAASQDLTSRFEAMRRGLNLILLGAGLLTCLVIFRIGRVRGASAAARPGPASRRARPPAPRTPPRSA